jgi:hypothetical protein
MAESQAPTEARAATAVHRTMAARRPTAVAGSTAARDGRRHQHPPQHPNLLPCSIGRRGRGHRRRAINAGDRWHKRVPWRIRPTESLSVERVRSWFTVTSPEREPTERSKRGARDSLFDWEGFGSDGRVWGFADRQTHAVAGDGESGGAGKRARVHEALGRAERGRRMKSKKRFVRRFRRALILARCGEGERRNHACGDSESGCGLHAEGMSIEHAESQTTAPTRVRGARDLLIRKIARARCYHSTLARVGVRIYEYSPSMLHAKTMVIAAFG